MITAFQIVLLIVIIITCGGTMVEKDNLQIQRNVSAVCVASITAFIVTVIWL